MRGTRRILYTSLFMAILLVEIGIALFVEDSFVRPYVGDMLVTVLLCCFCRIFFQKGFRLLPLVVFAFSALVEIGQYFDVVALLGLENNVLLSTVIGRTFSPSDLLCYAVGCLVFFAIERFVEWRLQFRGIL